MHKIELMRMNGNWMAKHSDLAVVELFGTDTLPTPYSSVTPSNVVLDSIKELNQDREVRLS